MKKLSLTPGKISATEITSLHEALVKLKINISPEEKEKNTIGESTTNAIKEIQKKNNLAADGKLNTRTLAVLNSELHHVHYTSSKTRTARLHLLLEKMGVPIDAGEKKKRTVSETTLKAITEFQRSNKLTADGKITEDFINNLQEAVVKKRYSAKTQIADLHGMLVRTGRIARLVMEISPNEIKEKTIGPTTQAAIRAFQEKYKIPVTGAMDKRTLEQLESVSASRGYKIKTLKQPEATELRTINKGLRMNMRSPKVAAMQRGLAHLGYAIDEKEYKNQFFGKTTRKAVLAYQKKNSLALTGQMETDTLRSFNTTITYINPNAPASGLKYRIRGSVRNELWQRMPNMVIRVYEKLINGESATPLVTKKTHTNGFFDITYDAPKNPNTGQVKDKFHLVIKLYNPVNNNPANDQLLDTQDHYNVNRIHWVNFTRGEEKYKGSSDYETTYSIVQKAINPLSPVKLEEKENKRQITHLGEQTGLSPDDIMRLVLAERAAVLANQLPVLDPEVFYAFIRQSLPPDLPGDLLLATSNWETIEQLTDLATTGVVFLEDEAQQAVLENALAQNLVPRTVKQKLPAVIAALKNLRTSYALQKPILTGNQNLDTLLKLSAIKPEHYNLVAGTFIANRGVNDEFWQGLEASSGTLGTAAIQDFTTTVEIGNIAKNHTPTVQFIKQRTGAAKQFRQAADLAKLDTPALETLINQNGNQVPPNMPGNTTAEKITQYASVLKARAENLFPAVALIANIKRGNGHNLVQLNEVEKFIDDHPALEFKKQNLDRYLAENSISLSKPVLDDLKVVQRIHKLTSDPLAGKALAEEKLHTAMQVYNAGKDRLVNMLKQRGVAEVSAIKIYEMAKMQYGQVIQRLLDFHPSITNFTPQAISGNNFTAQEIHNALGDIPDLETLFGSLDYCDCQHCKSLYGPAAYLTDMLRFLNEHNSLVVRNNRPLTVKQVLLERRPDLGHIKLNCDNTNTPLPYIDLVCEILENTFDPVSGGFSHQTTLTAKELRAMPQYIVPKAYEDLAVANYPMHVSFNLWQEETRTCLAHLRAPRFELMETFQNRSNPGNEQPSDAVIAAEFFALSAKEHDLVITARATNPDQNLYWDTDTTKTDMPVSDFLRRSKLSYYELMELLMTKFIDPALPPNRITIQRPADSCDTNLQLIIHLTVQKFDRLHRFIRLWRKTGWKMWELDLLLRNAKIGNNVINNNTLIKLKQFRQLQEKTGLPFEILLSFYGKINTEPRINPSSPEILVEPLYARLFRNISITNPLDDHFKISETDPLKVNIATSVLANESLPLAPGGGYTPLPVILSALAISQEETGLLIPQTNGLLSVNSLSVLLRYTYLAKCCRLGVKDLLLLLTLTNTSDPFATPETTATCIKTLEYIQASGLSLRDLDYLLNFNPDSSSGIREESVTQVLEGLRKILAANRENLDKLGLSTVQRNAILGFAFGGDIMPMTDMQLLAGLLPLQQNLEGAPEHFKKANFSAAEAEYILQFKTAPFTVAEKTNLLAAIDTLKQNILALINQNANQVTSYTAISFGINTDQAGFLLAQLTIQPGPVTIRSVLEHATMLDKNPDDTYIAITTANYPLQYKACALLHKTALLVQRMGINTDNLKFFATNFTGLNTLNFSALPVQAVAPPNHFTQWLNLYKFLSFQARYPEPENASLRSVLTMAQNSLVTKQALLNGLAALTQWNITQLTETDGGLQLKHLPGQLNYAGADTYLQLEKCFAMIRLTGADAASLFQWAVKNNALANDKLVAAETRQAVKSKYEQDDWLQKITPLNDDIREKKRFALVEYLKEDSMRTRPPQVMMNGRQIPNPLYWTDSNDVYKYFLIDVEMSACQLTSRIKQAISSVQFFVQRCFLNLENRFVQVSQDEKEDVSSPNAWSQWKWMKNYRIWEANRKVFFYPENWIEPELRDDKTPFFKELEDEIMQAEITHENVEAALLNYLHKLDDVAQLEVCGLYHEMEDLTPNELGSEINLVHVVARTKTLPHVHYYRKYDMNYSQWSAWEKIETEIEGDQLVPVVYNRKLHLFWLIFNEKPRKSDKIPPAQPSGSNTPQESPDPPKMLEIKLAWTVRKTGGWASKKVSQQKLLHPWERPRYAYNLKPFYLAKFNELYLDIYLSTTPEFNNGLFYDPYQMRKVRLTKNPFNETFLPWHSSAFIFDGEVKDIRLKPINAYYHVEFNLFGTPVSLTLPTGTNSFQFVHNNFGEDGRQIDMLMPIEYGPRLRLPSGMHFKYTKLTNNRMNNINSNQLRVLEGSASPSLLNNCTSPFYLNITQQDSQLNAAFTSHPMFYQDVKKAFFIKPEWEYRFNSYGHLLSTTRKYRFLPFYHPYTTLFVRELNRGGIDGLLNRNIQVKPHTFPPANNFQFNSYAPQGNVIADDTVKKDIVDFSFSGAYSVYNWELFFHAPLMIACRLSQNQRFEEAMRWFHYIFNPTDIETQPSPQRYWVTKPFFEYNSDAYRIQRIENILSNIQQTQNREQLKAWRNNPFKPHLVARYRPVAYQKNVVMKYIDNLIAWGDQLFRRDTIESINEAALLYMLAYEILGRRPEKVPAVQRADMSFNELETSLDNFGAARVDAVLEDTLLPIEVVPAATEGESLPNIQTFYFCIPNNDYLVKYWDTVEDRLFKIRHCMNIEGVVRQLPLFEPPIDPALLVKAAAAGIDLSSVLNDMAAGAPHYRFRIVVQKAIEFCAEVKMLGDKLLTVLEKKDAEELALLRSQHEIALLEAVKELKKKQIEEAKENINALNKSLAGAEAKKTFFDGREAISMLEKASLILSGASAGMTGGLALSNILAGFFHLIPNFSIGIAGFGGSPTLTMSVGGSMLASFAQGFINAKGQVANMLSQVATIINTLGVYERRKEDWKFQASLAGIEMQQVEFQIKAAEIRQAFSEKDAENQELQIENARTTDEYMRNKFTNLQLYSWMMTQISTVYFQAYQLAYDMAKKAEKCFRHELGIINSNIIQFGYWDSLKKGLLAGDKLMADLRKLEAEYIDKNKREFEITKHISLAQVSPASLVALKETGECYVTLPEWLFDMDYPGHYMRRIKTVSVSIPCIAGPFTGVNCTLSLLGSKTRIQAAPPVNPNDYAYKGEDDTRFKVQMGAISSIATSNAQNDPGLFELNFNDERYLPFEGSGAISDWKISMPQDSNYFDFNTISDVVLHVRYTSRDAGGQLAGFAKSSLQALLPDFTAKLFSLRHDFATEWHRFLHPEGAAEQELVITLQTEHFPFYIRNRLNTLKIKQLDLVMESAEPGDFTANLKVTSALMASALAVTRDAGLGNAHHLTRDLSGAPANALGEIRLQLKLSGAADFKSLPADKVTELYLLVQLGS